MTNIEAIKILGECKFCRNAYKGECVSDSGCFEAKTMAIEALKSIDQIKADGAINCVPATDRTGRCYVGNCPKCGGNVILRRPE